MVIGISFKASLWQPKHLQIQNGNTLRIDNTTAVAHLGGTAFQRHGSADIRKLWMWCLEMNIHITAQHFPRSQNTIANAESRSHMDRTDWKLSPIIFHKYRKLLVHWKWTSLQFVCQSSAHVISAGSQISVQRK